MKERFDWGVGLMGGRDLMGGGRRFDGRRETWRNMERRKRRDGLGGEGCERLFGGTIFGLEGWWFENGVM